MAAAVLSRKVIHCPLAFAVWASTESDARTSTNAIQIHATMVVRAWTATTRTLAIVFPSSVVTSARSLSPSLQRLLPLWLPPSPLSLAQPRLPLPGVPPPATTAVKVMEETTPAFGTATKSQFPRTPAMEIRRVHLMSALHRMWVLVLVLGTVHAFMQMASLEMVLAPLVRHARVRWDPLERILAPIALHAGMRLDPLKLALALLPIHAWVRLDPLEMALAQRSKLVVN